ncbi:hypothetical protein LAD12857_36580 [Lacrimispora amygdalina]|uniref:Uncharacterized protein n=1 Tax=Lacrimispora amygdalina TaxID=253257 RepID=A0ABQ5MA82_9FIRM
MLYYSIIMGRKDVYDKQEKKTHIYKTALWDFSSSHSNFNFIRISYYYAGWKEHGTSVYGKS